VPADNHVDASRYLKKDLRAAKAEPSTCDPEASSTNLHHMRRQSPIRRELM